MCYGYNEFITQSLDTHGIIFPLASDYSNYGIMVKAHIRKMMLKRLHRQLRETCSFHVTRYDAGRRRAVPSPSLEEDILNVVADRPESSTRAVAHHLS
ncbi:hypothetical protein TNCV_4132871 [Trichonephila clavipes]|nr:hypothetical protein TNCV_4132871 [Trichonephila clavipes]